MEIALDPRVHYSTQGYAIALAFADLHLREYSALDIARSGLDAACEARLYALRTRPDEFVSAPIGTR